MLPATKIDTDYAECTNADDLVSCMKNTINTCTVDHRVVAQRTYPYNSFPYQ